jgi:hypothetical protein
MRIIYISGSGYEFVQFVREVCIGGGGGPGGGCVGRRGEGGGVGGWARKSGTRGNSTRKENASMRVCIPDWNGFEPYEIRL